MVVLNGCANFTHVRSMHFSICRSILSLTEIDERGSLKCLYWIIIVCAVKSLHEDAASQSAQSNRVRNLSCVESMSLEANK